MAVPRRNLNGPSGPTFAHLHACTLAGYSAAGTQTPAVDDIVTLDATGNWYVELAENDRSKRMGIVRKIELDAVSTSVGYVVVEWFDAIRSVQVNSDDATTVTLLNSLIKDGDTTVEHNFDAGATTGPIVAVSKSAAAGAIVVDGLVFGS